MKKLYYIIIFLFVAIALQAQTIIYVKPNGVGDGSSWVKACDFIGLGEACFARTGPNVQIWVQKGTYYPSEMLSVPNSVKMYGGFSGTESNLSQRDSLSNSTIIDAQQKFGSVIRLGVSSELNGFVIQNGHAQDNPHKNGGGIFADDNSVIANCLIINNTASARGGGVYSKGTIKIIGSTIKDNMAIGGGANVFGNCLTVLGRSDEVVSVLPEQPEEPIIPVEPKEPETPIVATGCADGTFNLGTVSFASATERTITGNGITQVWSDAVTATGCQKTGFDGGSSGAYKLDCRSNPDYPGDLFSWCAVVRNASILCPAPWRVPATDDFVNLDKAMGGTGNTRTGVSSELPKYLGTGSNQWGAAYGGYVNAGTMYRQSTHAHYWSKTEVSADNGTYLTLSSVGLIYPQDSNRKYHGFTLRCIR